MEFQIPKLRTDLQITPGYSEGKRAVIIKDSLGLIQEPVILEGEILSFLSLINGKRSLRDIQYELILLKQGVLIGLDEVEKLIARFDDAFLLESERYHREKERIIAEYSLLDVRSTSHAGLSYPDSSEKLTGYLDSILDSEEESFPVLDRKKIGALVSPHIDFEAGKRVYAKAYQVLKQSSPKEIILLGTGHSLNDWFFSVCEKDFETPLGRIKTNRDSVRKLKEAGGSAVSPNDIAHRTEHSLEFQLIFLQHLFGSDFSLVPILCGSFTKQLERVSKPSDISEVNNFLEILKNCLEDYGSKTIVVSGVDFSHIGPKFGHDEQASSLLYEAEKHDKLLTKALCEGDVEAFWAESRRVHDRYNVCGFSTLACLLEILPRSIGHLLDYEIWREEPTRSAVSFAAIAFEVK
jgi:AmmeMemoRadiSam system protein B